MSYIAVSALQLKCVQNDCEQVKKKQMVTLHIKGMDSRSPFGELPVEVGDFERLHWV